MSGFKKAWLIVLVLFIGLEFESRITGVSWSIDALHPIALADGIKNAFMRYSGQQPPGVSAL